VDRVSASTFRLNRRDFGRLLLAGGAGVAVARTPLRAFAQQASPVASPVAGTKIVLATGFFPNVQFAPYYVAADNGYYAEAGLDVTFQDGPGADLLQQVGAGKIDFLIGGGDSLTLGKASGIPATYVMAQLQKYPVGALALANSGVTLKTPADLKGKKIGVSAPNGSTYIGLLALLQAGNLTLDDVEVISIGFTEVEALQQKQVDAAMTFITNEPVQVKAMGIDVQVLPVADFVNLVSTGLVTSDDHVKNDPDLVQAMVSATLRGLQATLADPDAAFAASLKRLPEIAGDATQEKIQRDVLDATLAFEQKPEGHPFGWSDPVAWQHTADLLLQVAMIDHAVDPTTLYTNRFAEAANIT
jgi:NitT/TauT family transport system substrate-binding protein